MSRGFWAAIGGIVGFYAGTYAGLAVAYALFTCCFGETMLPFFGSVTGVIVGPIVAWWIAGRLRTAR